MAKYVSYNKVETPTNRAGFFLCGFPVGGSVKNHRTIEFLSNFLEFFGDFLEFLGKIVEFLKKSIEFSVKI